MWLGTASLQKEALEGVGTARASFRARIDRATHYTLQPTLKASDQVFS